MQNEKTKDILSIVGILLLFASMASIAYLNGYYMNMDSRYTIATYRDADTTQLEAPLNFYSFTVGGRERWVRASGQAHGRILVAYSVEHPDSCTVMETQVPDYVQAAPEEGWTKFPPDLGWEGAKIDSTQLGN